MLEGAGGRRLLVQDVPPRPGQWRHALAIAVWAAEHIHYARYQTTLQQGLHQLFGYTPPPWTRSGRLWNCVEFYARTLCPQILVEGLRMGGRLFDTLTPRDMFDGLERYWALHPITRHAMDAAQLVVIPGVD